MTHHTPQPLKKIALSALTVLSAMSICSAQLQWELKAAPIEVASSASIFFVNNQFLLLTDSNLFTSNDGLLWNDVGLTLDCHFGKVTYGNKGYIFACDGGRIYSSPDLKSLKRDTLLENEQAYHTMAEYANGIYITAGYSNTPSAPWVFTSSNGSPWQRSCPDSSICCFLDAVYNDNRFLAVGAFDGVVMTSTDGATWTNRSTKITKKIYELWSIEYGNGRYVAAGYRHDGKSGTIVSTEGDTWSIGDTTSGVPYSSMAFGNGYFVVCGSKKGLYSSIDGIHWNRDSLSDTTTVPSVAFGNDRFVGINPSGGLYLSHVSPVPLIHLSNNSVHGGAEILAIRANSVVIRYPAAITGQIVAVTFTNATGREIGVPFTTTAGGGITASIAHLPEGWYFVSVKASAQSIGMPVIVTR